MITLICVLGIDFLMVGICLFLNDKDTKEYFSEHNANRYWNKQIKKYFKDIIGLFALILSAKDDWGDWFK